MQRPKLRVLPENFRAWPGRLAISVWLVLPAGTAGAAIGLTVSPSEITNDYTGTIVLSITGLAPGQTVRVQWICDQ